MTRRIKYIGGAASYQAFNEDYGIEMIHGKYIDVHDVLAERLLRFGEFVEEKESGFNPDTIRGNHKKCFIIGSGKSVEKLDLNKIDGHFSIAINFMYRHYPKTKSIFFLDKDVISRENAGAVPELKAYDGHIFCAMRSGYNVLDSRDNVVPFALNGTEPSLTLNDGLYGKKLSGVSSLNLAIILGFEEIYLLGYDGFSSGGVRVNDYGGRNNLYDNDWWEGRFTAFSKFETWKDRIYNCNPESELRLFQFADFNEVAK